MRHASIFCGALGLDIGFERHGFESPEERHDCVYPSQVDYLDAHKQLIDKENARYEDGDAYADANFPKDPPDPAILADYAAALAADAERLLTPPPHHATMSP